MSTFSLSDFRSYVKHSDTFSARFLKQAYAALKHVEVPNISLVYKPLYIATRLFVNTKNFILRVFFSTPMFKSVLKECGKKLYLEGGVPQVQGPLDISVGDECRISGVTTFSGRTLSHPKPVLSIGNNVDVSWMCSISVGTKVVLGDNVRIAAQCHLAGYPGHPLNAGDRAAGLPDTCDQAGDIILEQDVWLGTGCFVKSGVRIGQGAIVAARSVVVKNVPPFTLVAGNPAKVVKWLDV